MKPIQLGELIESFTRATGIKKLVSKDCGCDERRQKWNLLFRTGSPLPVRCMTVSELTAWSFLSTKRSTLSNQEQKIVAGLHASLFGHKYYTPCKCSPKEWLRMIDDLNKIYNTQISEASNEENQKTESNG